ncbi:MAG: hypothetical protein KJZ84_23410 [Bryobacteraceae bacterium]|nr:hypothetical protein [Bryobacteraceae bacterium]
MRIEILYFPGCPNHEPAVRRVRDVVACEGLAAEVREVNVMDECTGEQLGFLGSPTIRVDGLDIEPGARGAKFAGLACRRYPGGLPSEEMIRTALHEALAMGGQA